MCSRIWYCCSGRGTGSHDSADERRGGRRRAARRASYRPGPPPSRVERRTVFRARRRSSPIVAARRVRRRRKMSSERGRAGRESRSTRADNAEPSSRRRDGFCRGTHQRSPNKDSRLILERLKRGVTRGTLDTLRPHECIASTLTLFCRSPSIPGEPALFSPEQARPP